MYVDAESATVTELGSCCFRSRTTNKVRFFKESETNVVSLDSVILPYYEGDKQDLEHYVAAARGGDTSVIEDVVLFGLL